MLKKTVVLTLLCILLCSCGPKEEPKQEPEEEKGKTMALKITSPVFEDGEMIPARYTIDGRNISPPLQSQGVPDGTKSLALINDDPDAPMGTWVHWVVYNLPADTAELTENTPPNKTLTNGALQGTTDFGKIGYGGPAPPSGTHRYFFKLYAIDAMLDLPAGAKKKDVETAMQNHILDEAQLMGKYKRK